MLKAGHRYLDVDPWVIRETGFHPEQGRVSESVFSLGNEYMGVRGYFDEGYDGDRLVGSYCNGFYEEAPVYQASSYRGLISRARFMVNTVDWLFTRICVDGETLDLAHSRVSDFQRVLDFKTGCLTREFVWETSSGKSLRVIFRRLVSMAEPHLGCQQLTVTALDFSGTVEIQSGLDFSILHEEKRQNFWSCPRRVTENGLVAILGKTIHLGHQLFSAFRLETDAPIAPRLVEREKYIGLKYILDLTEGMPVTVEKIVTNYAERNSADRPADAWNRGMELAREYRRLNFDGALREHQAYWERVWNDLDITIEGDPENQQGIRFCIFQLHQTFHGTDPGLNIGAKGLTGEAYNGHTFWDTETYCLPFYIFNNPKAARNLLEFRYRTLPQAKERAIELDSKGAFYPIATIDGTESCGLWQHASLQLQVGSAVAYGIWHYVKLCRDKEFLYQKGIEILIEISRCYAGRGQWGQRTGEFGFFGVMGPDEFHMMVNNNCYLNFMARKTFAFTLGTLGEMESACPGQLEAIRRKTHLESSEISDWRRITAKMRLPQDPTTGVYEEHDGFFDLPHLEANSIPETEFPLYEHWSYDRIYRYDLIKQPDVLMFIFLYNQDFSEDIKRANYQYYEPRCIHESSLSPSIHSILGAELGYHERAFDLCRFATRLDLDNYNRNTSQGLHITSLAAAWMNIVYGFGGMRSDGERLLFNPTIPASWQAYSFRIIYQGANLCLNVNRESVELRSLNGVKASVRIYGADYQADDKGVKIQIPDSYRV